MEFDEEHTCSLLFCKMADLGPFWANLGSFLANLDTRYIFWLICLPVLLNVGNVLAKFADLIRFNSAKIKMK